MSASFFLAVVGVDWEAATKARRANVRWQPLEANSTKEAWNTSATDSSW